MDEIEYAIAGKKSIIKELEPDPLNRNGFLLTNRAGSFFSLPIKGANSSFYYGYFLKKTTEEIPVKFIETLRIRTEEDIRLINRLWCAERLYKESGMIERFTMPEGTDLLIYESENSDGKELEVVLDIREIYDFDRCGRDYKITKEGNRTIITYRQTYTTIVETECRVYQKDTWEPASYALDMKRENRGSDWYVFHALNIMLDKDSRIVFSMGRNEKEAMEGLRSAKNEMKKTARKTRPPGLIPSDMSKDEMACAVALAENALDTLKTKEGLYAGLWWFFQLWARDEAISTGALIRQGNQKKAKDILLRNIQKILPDGRIPNRYPRSILGSADGVGWAFRRLMELPLTRQEREEVKNKLSIALERLERSYLKEGLIENKALETWMDTGRGHDTRKGFRIEIQALYLAMLDYMYSLSKDRRYKKQKDKTLERMKEFIDEKNKIIADGLDDFTVRPNAFLACYIYPKMFTKKRWKMCLENMLQNLWCEWSGYGGGVATIQKDSRLFCPEYTGIDNRSYHRGDSWFYVNNIVAIVLTKIDKKTFKEHISKILESSSKQLLYRGLSGFSAELSSADSLDPNGCPAQAWSIASFIELCSALKHI